MSPEDPDVLRTAAGAAAGLRSRASRLRSALQSEAIQSPET